MPEIVHRAIGDEGYHSRSQVPRRLRPCDRSTSSSSDGHASEPCREGLGKLSFTFSFNLNTAKVSLSGSFHGLPATLDFTVEYLKEFDGAGGKNIVFYSEKTSDNAGYVIAVQLVAAS
jgi:hypothetical protein